MAKDHIAKSSTTINAPVDDVWDALVDPKKIKKYMFGTTVTSKWTEGSPIKWKGEFKGKKYEDKGVIQRFEPGEVLEYTHFSPMEGKPDAPENYHTVTIELTPSGKKTKVVLSQNNNPTVEAKKHSEQNWSGMLEGLKKMLEE